ncbi:MAG: hypothetical protein VX497_04870 [Candidatus Neomarinimicrobiota bacterium]|nr:hypothetical protein [Candidatus Neomarinimicrobiota bacterium]
MGGWVDFDMIRYILFLPFIVLSFWGCEENQNSSEGNPDPIITFEKNIGNAKSAVRQTKDEGYIIAGGQGGKAWLLKLDKYGNEEWQNTYSLGDFGLTRAVIQTNDGGYLYASWEGIVKADSNGVEEWKNGEVGQYPNYEDVIQHSNGNYYAVGGPSGGQAKFVKFSPQGNILTQKYFGTNCEDDIFRSITESNDGMLIVVGEKSHGNQLYDCAFNFMYYKDFWILKLKKNGGLIWEKTYGGPYMEKADDVVAIENGGYAMIGDMCLHNYNINTCGSVAKVLYIKVDENGEKVEEKSWSGLKFMERIPHFSITTTSSGGIAWTAEHKNKGSWVHKWGSMEDTTTIYTNGNGGFDINKTSDNGFIIGTLGGTIIKTDSELYYDEIIEEES